MLSNFSSWKNRAASAFFQAGVAHHRQLYLSEIIGDFESHMSERDPPNAAFDTGLLVRPDNDQRERVAWYYETATAFAPEFANAHYNLARLWRRAGRIDDALALYLRAAQAQPHPRARPQASLTANAYWEAASIEDRRGRLEEAEVLYRHALRLQDNFGPEHVQFPRLLQRLNKNREALDHYERITTYSHRYAAEFIEPDYKTNELLPRRADGAPLDPAVFTRLGQHDSHIFYFAHLYFHLPNVDKALDIVELRKALPRRPLLRFFGQARQIRCSPRPSALPGDGISDLNLILLGKSRHHAAALGLAPLEATMSFSTGYRRLSPRDPIRVAARSVRAALSARKAKRARQPGRPPSPQGPTP